MAAVSTEKMPSWNLCDSWCRISCSEEGLHRASREERYPQLGAGGSDGEANVKGRTVKMMAEQRMAAVFVAPERNGMMLNR